MGEVSRALIIEDHALIAHGLAVALEAEGIRTRITTGPTTEDVLSEARAFRPDVVLLDLQLDGEIGSGVPLIRPLVMLDAAVVVVTGVRDRVALGECLEAGATALVSKSDPFDDLVELVLRVARGGRVRRPDQDELLDALRIHRKRSREQLAPFERLTAKESYVFGCLIDGFQADAIADVSCVSITTVRSQIRSILQKLGVRSQLAAVAMARDAGWTPAVAPSAVA